MTASTAHHRTDDILRTASLVLRNDVAELTRLSAWLGKLAGRWALSGRDTYRLELALTEIVTNILEHGNLTADQPGVAIQLERDRHQLVATIVDDGVPFNPLAALAHASPATLDETRVGGLGIHLVRHACDNCFYARADGKNVFTMIFEGVTDQ